MPATCARCHAELQTHELEGLCPRCLVQNVPIERFDSPPLTTPAGRFVAPVPAQLAPLFPQLEVIELLGQGGMGAVYKARQVKLDRLVALKVLPPEAADGPGFAERFTREARALARLNHPHIVGVYDFGEVGGLYYLVMEYVEGVNLRQALAEGKLRPEQALALVTELCAALQYAHEMGVVHRDIKPENVLLDRQGRVKVADFGLAKLVGPAQAPRLTGTGQAMGTPHYMAPEQWERPLEVDHRADIYSLGVVFYELLTGELPVGKFAPPSQKAGVDERLDGVVLRAMEKQPAQRYQQMSEMRSAVEAVEQGPIATPAPAATTRQLSREIEVLVTLAMVAGVVGAGVGLWLLKPYTIESKFHSWLGVAVGLVWAASWTGNRWLQRLWGVAYVAAGLTVVWGEVIGQAVLLPLWGEVGWWGWLIFGYLGWSAWASFAESFRPESAETEGGDAEPIDGKAVPVVGLSPREEALRLLLMQMTYDLEYQLSVLPDIDSELLTTARVMTEAASDDRILGVVDFSEGGEAALCLGCQAMYWRNADDSPHPGTGRLSYEELARRRVVNHGDAVYLGNDQYICPNEGETGLTAEQVAELLHKVREAVGGEKGNL